MISAEEARELLSYDPETGALTWKKATNWRIRPGSRAGTLEANGYLRVSLYRKLYQAHRIAWLIKTGSFPSLDIDHINGVRNDNRWSNLREATREQNGRNQAKPLTNTSGVIGVYWHKRIKKWAAAIRAAGVHSHLGYFANFNDAVSARRRAEYAHGFHENHGRNSTKSMENDNAPA